MSKISRETVLSYALGFVALWFGGNEIMDSGSWAGYLPPFLTETEMANTIVFAHGILLVASGLSLVFNFYRRMGAFVLFLLLLGIVGTLLFTGGLNEISVRDIGLLGMALALSLRS